jgi:hypothetical protein
MEQQLVRAEYTEAYRSVYSSVGIGRELPCAGRPVAGNDVCRVDPHTANPQVATLVFALKWHAVADFNPDR